MDTQNVDLLSQPDSKPIALHPGKWFERPFDFEHINLSAAGIIERLRYTPLRLQAQISSLTTRQLIQKVDDQWSIQENIGHLLDLEPLWLGRVHDILNGLPTLQPADLQNRQTHEANHNQTPVQQLLDAFSAARQNFVWLCEKNHAVLTTASALHPRLLTPMRIIDLMYFVAEHDDHHIATINYLKNQ